MKMYPKSVKIGYPLGALTSIVVLTGFKESLKTLFYFFFFSAQKDVKGRKEEKKSEKGKKGCPYETSNFAKIMKHRKPSKWVIINTCFIVECGLLRQLL